MIHKIAAVTASHPPGPDEREREREREAGGRVVTRVSDLVRVSQPRRHHCPLHAAVTVAGPRTLPTLKVPHLMPRLTARGAARLAWLVPLSVASVATPGPARRARLVIV